MNWKNVVENLEWGCFKIHPPASLEQIQRLESVLGFSLPSDLHDFYTQANGLYGDNNGWEYQIVASTNDVIQNLKAIQTGYQKKYEHTDFTLTYPQVLLDLPIIPINDGDNTGYGYGFFYWNQDASTHSRLTRHGIYAHLVGHNEGFIVSDIEFATNSLESYINQFFSLPEIEAELQKKFYPKELPHE